MLKRLECGHRFFLVCVWCALHHNIFWIFIQILAGSHRAGVWGLWTVNGSSSLHRRRKGSPSREVCTEHVQEVKEASLRVRTTEKGGLWMLCFLLPVASLPGQPHTILSSDCGDSCGHQAGPSWAEVVFVHRAGTSEPCTHLQGILLYLVLLPLGTWYRGGRREQMS